MQRFPLCFIESNGNENFKVIQKLGFLPDHPQNWITGSLCHSRHTIKISERSVHNFLSYLANTQTDRRTKSGKNITSLVEVKMALYWERFYATAIHFAQFLIFPVKVKWIMDFSPPGCFAVVCWKITTSALLTFLRAKAGTAIARLSYRNSVRLSVCHTGGSGKNGPS